MKGLVAIVTGGLLTAFWASQSSDRLSFRDIAEDAGIRAVMRCGGPEKKWIPEANGSGLAWLDFNNDGLMDLLIVNGGTMERLRATVAGKKLDSAPGGVYLYKNLGHGRFEDVTDQSRLSNPYWGTGANAADFDNDGWTDILITAIGIDLLYRNNGNGTFTEIGGAAGLSRDVAWHTGSTFGDFDGDGYLDLYIAGYTDVHAISLNDPAPVCPYNGKPAFCGPIGLKPEHGILYRNNGNGTFTDVSARSGVGKVKPAHSFTPVFADFNGDGRPDLFVANDSDPNYLLLNNGDGTFEEAALDRGVALNVDGRVQSNMGVAIGYSDRSSPQLNLLTTTFYDDYFPLFRADRHNGFEEVSATVGLTKLTKPYLGWACGFTDFSNRGIPDLWLANGHVYPNHSAYFQPITILENRDGHYQHAFSYPPVLNNSYRGGATGDFDNDGRMDLAILPIEGRPLLLQNQTAIGNSWIGFLLRGTKSNRDAIGATVETQACGETQFDAVRNGGSYVSQNDPRVHFGLGNCNALDHVTIRWPSGLLQRLPAMPTNRYHTIEEPR